MFERPLIVRSSVPAIAAGVGAGTSPTIAISGNDTTGTITLTPGNTATALAVLATITFSTAYSGGVRVSFTPTGADSFNSGVVVTSESTTNFVISSNITPLTTGTPYKWNYLVIPL